MGGSFVSREVPSASQLTASLNQEIMMSSEKNDTYAYRVIVGPGSKSNPQRPLAKIVFDATMAEDTINFINITGDNDEGWLGQIRLDRPSTGISGSVELVVSLAIRPEQPIPSKDDLLPMMTFSSQKIGGQTVIIGGEKGAVGLQFANTPEDGKPQQKVTEISNNTDLGDADTILPTQGAVKSYVDGKVGSLEGKVDKLANPKPTGPQWVADGSNGIRFDDGPVTVARTLTVSQGIILAGPLTFSGSGETLSGVTSDATLPDTATALVPTGGAVKLFVQSQVNSVSDKVKTLSDTVKTLGGKIPAGSQWRDDGSAGIQFDGNVKVGNTLTVSQGIILAGPLTFSGSGETLSGVTSNATLPDTDTALVPTGGAVKSFVQSQVKSVSDTVKTLSDTVNTLGGKIPAGSQWRDDGSGGLRFDDGAVTVGKALTVSQGIICGGNVGIGTSTPADALEVAGNLRILTGTGSHPIRFTSAWSDFPAGATNQAEISNDTDQFKTLMIVGNRSKDPNTRMVSVWDRLEVKGQIVSQGISLTGGLHASVPGTMGGTFTLWDGNGDIAFDGGDDGIFGFMNTKQGTGVTFFAGINSKGEGYRLLEIDNETGAVSGKFQTSSSRTLKTDIRELSTQDAATALDALEPVTFLYLATPDMGRSVGFIAEDVPDLVASHDRKTISPMEIVGVLTQVVKDLKKRLQVLEGRLAGG
jgi:Chaperone of endosialidase